MINWDQVRELREEIGQDDFGEVVIIFLQEVEDIITRLKNADDRMSLEADLHALKGCALNLGFSTFAELCHTGEKLAAAGDAKAVDLGHVFQCYDASKRQFQAGSSNL